MRSEDSLALVDREIPDGAMGHHRADHFGEVRIDRIVFAQISWVGNQEFARCVSREGVGQIAPIATLKRECPGREFSDRDGHSIIRSRGYRRHQILTARFQQRLVDQGAWREYSGDRSINHTLGFLGILDLIADRDPNSLLHESPKIILRSMVRNPGHGHALGSFRQGDSEEPVRRLGIRAEELVEVAHPEEK